MAETHSTQTSGALDSKIQTLCQELQDMILEFVQDHDIPTKPVMLDKYYKTPGALQISRKTRATFAKKYYGVAYFECTVIDVDGVQFDKWFHTMDHTHFALMKHIEVTYRHIKPWDLNAALEHYYAVNMHEIWQVKLENAAKGKLENLDLVIGHATSGKEDKRRFRNGVFLKD